mmetsp:Transcript_54650/g.102318  ORF Transcript_54650/g.102318 Transcript_54650/m.102318 type:complete len:214 (-) Transcript_54650:527-1168(-)
MFASNAWAVQMLLVALSRRMCCSRVCIAMRRAGCPRLSMVTPMMRPGMRRAYLSEVAMKAACGPPKPMGTPKRCADPTAMSAPHSPGGASCVSAIRSVAATTRAPASLALVTTLPNPFTAPVVSGYCSSKPAKLASSCASSTLPSTSSIPAASARVLTKALVCGCTLLSTKNLSRLPLVSAKHMLIASAAAVASSRRDALAMGMPVRSDTMVW